MSTMPKGRVAGHYEVEVFDGNWRYDSSHKNFSEAVARVRSLVRNTGGSYRIVQVVGSMYSLNMMASDLRRE